MGKPTAPSGSSGRAKAAVETPSEELTFEETMKNNSLPVGISAISWLLPG